jgi:glycosyltransferase involved in cell wall biosynthesis
MYCKKRNKNTRWKNGNFVFGFIKKYKGLEYLVSAFQKIKRELDNITLLIVGGLYNGGNEDFKFYSDLIDLISHDDDIICVNEYVPFEKINSYFWPQMWLFSHTLKHIQVEFCWLPMLLEGL